MRPRLWTAFVSGTQQLISLPTVPSSRAHVSGQFFWMGPTSHDAAVDLDCFLYTGHSLGGALATLAAQDLQAEFRFPQLYCYTFGAPRTGNHAFAAESTRLVPETWHVINDQDSVTRVGKFWFAYKR